MFQTGTPINPQLLSNQGMTQGMLQASAIQASALADLGAKVGDGITKYKEKKKEKEMKDSTISSIETIIRNNPEMQKTLGLSKEAIDTGQIDEAGNPIFDFKIDDGEIKAASSEIFNVLGQKGSTAIIGANYLQAIEGEDDSFGGIGDAIKFRDEVSDNDNYKLKRVKGKEVLMERDLDGKFKPADANSAIFKLTDNPKAFYAMFSVDSQGLYD